MPTKISLISSNTMESGCLEPNSLRFPGKVTSMVSCFNLCSSNASFKCAAFCVNVSSIAARTSLASCPITGRSSADSLPICFKIAVSSPFFPRYFTRKFSKPCWSSASSIAFSANWRMVSSCCFIQFDILSKSYHKRDDFDIKKAFIPKQGRRRMLRGTTLIFVNQTLV